MDAYTAMHTSATNNTPVTIVNPSAEDLERLLTECEAHTDQMDFWGEHPDGGTWRVYVRREPA